MMMMMTIIMMIMMITIILTLSWETLATRGRFGDYKRLEMSPIGLR